MSKAIKLTDLYVGQLVTLSESEETQVYTVGKIDRLAVLLKWKEGTRDCETWSVETYYLPTLKQIEYSLHQNGPLVSAADI
jgi:hypothetical protein